jgi:outer membrane lipoprotein-sorting protein
MINYFYEKNIDGESIVSTPGSTSLVVPKSGEVRGAIEYNDKAYFVIGHTFYEVNSAGTATSRGTLNTSTGRVSMAHNGLRNSANQQIMIVDGSDGWIYDNSASTLTVISDADFTDSTSVVFIDGYFIFAQKDSDRFWLTASYDGTTISATDFETAEGDPDDIQALIADQRELFVFGKRTLEVWYNSGDTNNTFQRFQGGFKQTGCVAKFSPARVAMTTNTCYYVFFK